jgi:hypothetical protein
LNGMSVGLISPSFLLSFRTVRCRCQCYVGLNGEEEWTGPDCSLSSCPKYFFFSSLLSSSPFPVGIMLGSQRWSQVQMMHTRGLNVRIAETVIDSLGIRLPPLPLSCFLPHLWGSSECECFPGYAGLSCQRNECPNV